MLRISEADRTTERVVLRLEGDVMGPWVAEMRRACEQVLSEGRRLTLDLGEVSFVEREAVQVLRELMCREVQLINCSPFISEQLKNIPPSCRKSS